MLNIVCLSCPFSLERVRFDIYTRTMQHYFWSILKHSFLFFKDLFAILWICVSLHSLICLCDLRQTSETDQLFVVLSFVEHDAYCHRFIQKVKLKICLQRDSNKQPSVPHWQLTPKTAWPCWLDDEQSLIVLHDNCIWIKLTCDNTCTCIGNVFDGSCKVISTVTDNIYIGKRKTDLVSTSNQTHI